MHTCYKNAVILMVVYTIGPCTTTAAEWMAVGREKQTSWVCQGFPHSQYIHLPLRTHTHTHTHTQTRLIPANYVEVVPVSRSSQLPPGEEGASASGPAASGSQGSPPRQQQRQSATSLQRQLLRDEKDLLND